MEWKPIPWIAAALSLIVTPLGMLYVKAPKLAAIYWLVAIATGVLAFTSIFGQGSEALSTAAGVLGWIVSIGCAVHSYRLAQRAAPATERPWYSRWYGLAAFPVAVLVAVFLFRAFGYEPFRTPSESMLPTLPPGSVVFVDKSGYGHYGTFGIRLWKGEARAPLARGDIVVHRLVADPTTAYVGRVIGMPGDHVIYADRRLILNGKPVPIEFGRKDGIYQYAIERMDNVEVTIALIPERYSRDFDQVVPPGQLVIFGDSRDNARDSRYIGLVPRENVVGRVVKIFRSQSQS